MLRRLESTICSPKLAALMDEAEADAIAFMVFPRAHWPKLHSNPLERPAESHG